MRHPLDRRDRAPHYTRGQVRGGHPRGWSPWRGTEFTPRIRESRGGMSRNEALRRGEWQRHGHGPGAWAGYGWEYRGGAPRGRYATWPERHPGRRAGGGRTLAEERSGGLPPDRERYDPERWQADELQRLTPARSHYRPSRTGPRRATNVDRTTQTPPVVPHPDRSGSGRPTRGRVVSRRGRGVR